MAARSNRVDLSICCQIRHQGLQTHRSLSPVGSSHLDLAASITLAAASATSHTLVSYRARSVCQKYQMTSHARDSLPPWEASYRAVPSSTADPPYSRLRSSGGQW